MTIVEEKQAAQEAAVNTYTVWHYAFLKSSVHRARKGFSIANNLVVLEVLKRRCASSFNIISILDDSVAAGNIA